MARGRKSPLVIELSLAERETLQGWQRSTTMAAELVRRGRTILPLADRHSQSQVAQLVGVQRPVVRYRPVHQGMASAGPSVPLAHEIRGQDHGRSTCSRSLIWSRYL